MIAAFLLAQTSDSDAFLPLKFSYLNYLMEILFVATASVAQFGSHELKKASL